MRLYRILGAVPYFVGTQAEAKADARLVKAKWELVDVPTDKTGLIEFLNTHAVVPAEITITGGEQSLPEMIERLQELPRPETAQDQPKEVLMDFNPGDDNRVRDRFQPQEHRLAERAAFLGTSEEIALLTDRIGELDGWPLGQVALAAASRLKELADG